jgi:hypothetical protein
MQRNRWHNRSFICAHNAIEFTTGCRQSSSSSFALTNLPVVHRWNIRLHVAIWSDRSSNWFHIQLCKIVCVTRVYDLGNAGWDYRVQQSTASPSIYRYTITASERIPKQKFQKSDCTPVQSLIVSVMVMFCLAHGNAAIAGGLGKLTAAVFNRYFFCLCGPESVHSLSIHPPRTQKCKNSQQVVVLNDQALSTSCNHCDHFLG